MTISRAQGSLIFPANLQLAAAKSPCPYGYYGDLLRPCTCSSTKVTRYQKRISGPMMDRIDIHMQVPRVEYQKLRDMQPGESSPTVRVRTGDSGVRFLLLNDESLGEPIAWGGPIVMNPREELNQAFQDLRDDMFIQ